MESEESIRLEGAFSHLYSTSLWSSPLFLESRNLVLALTSPTQSWIHVQEDFHLRKHVSKYRAHIRYSLKPKHQRCNCMACSDKLLVTCSMAFLERWEHGHSYSQGPYWYQSLPISQCCFLLRTHSMFWDLYARFSYDGYILTTCKFTQTTAWHLSL